MLRFNPIPLQNVKLSDSFLAKWVNLNSETVIPYNVRRCKETGRIDAFKLKWKEGMPNMPHVFWDSDFAKVIEGMCLDLISHPDKKREKELDKYVDLIISAQQPDGYLNTHFTVVEPEKRWSHLGRAHELYCAGHLMEAAVAHFQATGNRKFLDCLCRYADYIGTVFGKKKGQKKGYPGHEEIELALCKLADASGNPKYAELAKYFIDQRGQKPNYFVEECKRLNIPVPASFDNVQAHIPVREQKDAVGHAVRDMYLCCGMAEVAARFNDKELLKVCEAIYDSVTKRRMYITGGIGSSEKGERFTADYHLPNAYAYAESCASIGLALFAMRMGNITGEDKYFETMERAIFNGILSGLAMNGTEFFYENKLEVNQATADAVGHHEGIRQPWFNCSCCPTNFCRFLAQIPQLAFSYTDKSFRVNMPINAEIELPMAGGRLKATITGNYPLGNSYKLHIKAPCKKLDLSLRIPAWADNAAVYMNGKLVSKYPKEFYTAKGPFKKDDEIEVRYDLNVHFNYADPRVSDAAGKVALSYGPFIMALESTDNATADMSTLLIDTSSSFRLSKVKGLPDGTPVIKGSGFIETAAEPGILYSSKPPKRKACTFTAIPYCLWQNRGPSNMAVWFRQA